jgi:hypothetical protein
MENLNDVGLGDTVRLRNGETVVVESKFTSYTDASGEHEGPFVGAGPHGRDHYLLSDVVEVVAPNPRRCRFCGEGVTSTNDEVDFCRNCHYTGRAQEERRGDLIGRLGDLDLVGTARIWHTGGGCFLLAVELVDGRLVTCTDGEASLPEDGEPWGLVVVSPNQEAWDEWDEGVLDIRQAEWTDDQLVSEIRCLDAPKVVDLGGERQYREEFRTGRDPRD